MTGKLNSKKVAERLDDSQKQFLRRSLRLSQKNSQTEKKLENSDCSIVLDNISKQKLISKSGGNHHQLQLHQHEEIIDTATNIISAQSSGKISVRRDLIDKSLLGGDYVSNDRVKARKKKRTRLFDNMNKRSLTDNAKKGRRSVSEPKVQKGGKKDKKTTGSQRKAQRKFVRSQVTASDFNGNGNSSNSFPRNYKEELKNLKLTCYSQTGLPLYGKPMLPEVYPSHFKYQLPVERVPYQLSYHHSLEDPGEQPVNIMTPEETETPSSSSTSPSMPESLRGLFDTDDIHELLNVEPVIYRLTTYQVQALAAILHLSVVYLIEALDRVVSLPFATLVNIDRTLNMPITGDEDLFSQNLPSPDYIVSSETPHNSRIFPSQKK